MSTTITEEEFDRLLGTFERSAFHLEPKESPRLRTYPLRALRGNGLTALRPLTAPQGRQGPRRTVGYGK